MGKKSRLKREQKEIQQYKPSFIYSDSIKPLITNPQATSKIKSVYRFFMKENEAEALTRGQVWISTLKTCRNYENPEQGDPQEAYETYSSGYIKGDGNDLDFVARALKSGIYIDPSCRGGTIDNCSETTYIVDSYILCTTKVFSPEKLSDTFGRYCVEITDPLLFFKLVSDSLSKKIPLIEALSGSVVYADRTYTGMESPPSQIGFVKPKVPYETQNEFRFIWNPVSKKNLTPFLLNCPEVSHLCKRIS